MSKITAALHDEFESTFRSNLPEDAFALNEMGEYDRPVTMVLFWGWSAARLMGDGARAMPSRELNMSLQVGKLHERTSYCRQLRLTKKKFERRFATSERVAFVTNITDSTQSHSLGRSVPTAQKN